MRAAGHASSAYHRVANVFIDPDALISLARTSARDAMSDDFADAGLERHPDPEPQIDIRPAIDYPVVIHDLARVAEFPKIAPDGWPTLFDALAEYAATHVFNLTECTAWVRDRIAETNYYVGRHIIANVIRGAGLARVRLDSHPAPTAAALRDGFMADRKSVV